MTKINEVRAQVYFFTAQEGGRSKPVWSGYRPALDFGLKGIDGKTMYHDCILTIEEHDEALLGKEYLARIKPLRPDLLQMVLKQGVSFDITEGGFIRVGKGIIVDVFGA